MEMGQELQANSSQERFRDLGILKFVGLFDSYTDQPSRGGMRELSMVGFYATCLLPLATTTRYLGIIITISLY